jgi:hypothetical protein
MIAILLVGTARGPLLRQVLLVLGITAETSESLRRTPRLDILT